MLLALVDGNYKFIWADVSVNVPSSDPQMFEECELKNTIEQGVIGFPPLDPLLFHFTPT